MTLATAIVANTAADVLGLSRSRSNRPVNANSGCTLSVVPPLEPFLVGDHGQHVSAQQSAMLRDWRPSIQTSCTSPAQSRAAPSRSMTQSLPGTGGATAVH
jgi:hypothetical protein